MVERGNFLFLFSISELLHWHSRCGKSPLWSDVRELPGNSLAARVSVRFACISNKVIGAGGVCQKVSVNSIVAWHVKPKALTTHLPAYGEGKMSRNQCPPKRAQLPRAWVRRVKLARAVPTTVLVGSGRRVLTGPFHGHVTALLSWLVSPALRRPPPLCRSYLCSTAKTMTRDNRKRKCVGRRRWGMAAGSAVTNTFWLGTPPPARQQVGAPFLPQESRQLMSGWWLACSMVASRAPLAPAGPL